MAFLFISTVESIKAWAPPLHAAIPGLDLRHWQNDAPDGGDGVGDTAEIDYIITAIPPEGVISRQRFPNIKAIFGMWAGVDSLLKDPTFPRDIPYMRLVDGGLKSGMAEYMTAWTLYFHRGFHVLADQQRRHEWREILPAPDTAGRRVGILGLGELGQAAAHMLGDVGFRNIAGWSRTEKAVPGVQSFFGQDQLAAFLNRSEILIALLPLTPETDGILNAEKLSALPQGAVVINAGRGRHVVAADLLKALDSGHLAGAVLDVCEPEPLPADSPFWDHPKVIITPHTSSMSVPDIAAHEIAANLKRIAAGEMPSGLVDWSLGY